MLIVSISLSFSLTDRYSDRNHRLDIECSLGSVSLVYISTINYGLRRVTWTASVTVDADAFVKVPLQRHARFFFFLPFFREREKRGKANLSLILAAVSCAVTLKK